MRTPFRKTTANERAEALLAQHLTPEQLESWKKEGHFEVGRHKRIARYLDEVVIEGKYPRWTIGNGWRRHCFFTYDVDMPMADKALAFKLYLEGLQAGRVPAHIPWA